MTQLLRYTRMGKRTLTDGELWVAITTGSPDAGGDGVVVWGFVEPLTEPTSRRQLMNRIRPGDRFVYGDKDHFADNGGDAAREVVDLADVPDRVAAAWLKFHHLGRIPA